jgi:aconitate hydratase
LDLNTVEPCISGPKRPQDRVLLSKAKEDFNKCAIEPVGFKGFGVPVEKVNEVHKFSFKGEQQ